MSADIKRAQEKLTKGGTLGGVENVVFDGFAVREMTKDEIAKAERRRASTVAGAEAVGETSLAADIVAANAADSAAQGATDNKKKADK